MSESLKTILIGMIVLGAWIGLFNGAAWICERSGVARWIIGSALFIVISAFVGCLVRELSH